MSQQGPAFQKAAEALAEADPNASAKKSVSKTANSSTTVLLEKKWTAVSRLQKKVMDLEKQISQSAKIHGHRPAANGERRMLPRPPAAHTLTGHRANVTCVEVHPVFTVAVSGSEDGTIKVWDHESGEFVRTLKGHTNTVHCLSFTPTGTHLASSSSDLSVKIWDFSTYTCVRTLRGHDHTISAVKFIPNPSALAESNDEGHPGCTHLASASRDHTIKFWDFETGFCVHTATEHTDWVRCLAVKQDGSMIASSGNDTSIIIQATDGERKKTCELRGHEHVVESISFVNAPKTSKVHERGSLAKSIEEVNDYLASGSRDRTVRLWSISGATCLSVFSFHENWVRSVIIHPSGKYIISSSDDRSIRVIDIKANRCMRSIEGAHDHFVCSIAMHHTLPILVSGSVDQSVKCWALE